MRNKLPKDLRGRIYFTYLLLTSEITNLTVYSSLKMIWTQNLTVILHTRLAQYTTLAQNIRTQILSVQLQGSANLRMKRPQTFGLDRLFKLPVLIERERTAESTLNHD